MNDAAEPRDVEAFVTGGRLDRLLDLARTARAPRHRRWLVDAVERALLLADPGAVSSAQRDEAVALGADPSVAEVADVVAPTHGVLLPFAPRAGQSGIVRLVYVSFRATGDDGTENVFGPSSRAAIGQALELAQRFARPPAGRGPYGLSAAQPEALRRLRVDGASLGAAAFVSAVALWSRRHVLPGTLVTGELRATGIDGVGGLAAKIEASLHGRPDVRRLVVPSRDLASVRAAVEQAGASVEVAGVTTLESLLDATLEPEPRAEERPDDAVAEARRAFVRGWRGFRWPAQREPLERLVGGLPPGRPDLAVEALTMLGAVTRHIGAPDESLAVLEQALAIVESDESRDGVPDLPLAELHQHLALTLRQLCRFGDAARMAARAVRVAKRGRLRGELLEAHGCAGLVALSRGRARDAVAHQRAALAIVHGHRPASCPRTHGYLAQALGLAGDLDGARDEYRAGLAHLDERSRGTSREAWLRTSFATALAAHARWDEVRRALDAPPTARAVAHDPLPGLVARRWLGLALAEAGEPETGWELLAASPAVHGRGAMPHVRFLAHLNVLYEARSRVSRGALGPDAVERARTALAHLPRYGEADVFLGPAARAVDRALAEGRNPRVPLDRLLPRCQRIT